MKLLRRITPENRWLLAIILLSLALRLGAAFYMGDGIAPLPGVDDQNSYDALARRVLAGHGFSFDRNWWPATKAGAPTAHWSFLYTLYLAGVYALFGPHPLVARLIQVIASGILMPWLTYRLGRHAFGPLAGLAAAAISAVYIYFFFYGAALMTETFFLVGILATLNLLITILAHERPRFYHWLAIGLVMGLTVLLRQTFLPVIALLAAWLWFAAPGRRLQITAGCFLSLAVVVALMLPFTLRNQRAFGQFVLLNTNAGYAFFWANHPIHGANFMTLLPPEISYGSLIPAELRGLNEAALEKALMQAGVQFILDDPGRYVLLSINRLKDQFKFWPSADSGLFSNLSRVGSFGLFLPFMLYGAWLALARTFAETRSAGAKFIHRATAWLRTPVALWFLYFLFYTAMHLASWASVRYRLPTDIVTVIFAGLGLIEALAWIQKRLPSAWRRLSAVPRP